MENQNNQVTRQSKLDVDLAIEARWVAPVTQISRLLENTSVILREGIIVDILPRLEAGSR